MHNDDKNPLNVFQRETAGSDTWRKYRYQYNWALYEMIQNHKRGKNYVIFMEYHEDVVFADSLDRMDVKFSFNQVKTTTKKYTASSLCKRESKKLSILGKLIDNCIKKTYSSLIQDMAIVSTGGFSFNCEDNSSFTTGRNKFSKIKKEQLNLIEANITKELSSLKLPDNLYFEIPVLPEKGFQDMVIGAISRLISKLHPSSKFDSNEIYRILMDELGRKGEITEQFSKWDEAIEHKGLTSETVNTIINQHTQIKDEVKIQTELLKLCDELKHDSISRRQVVSAFRRFSNQVLNSQDMTILRITRKCSSLILEQIQSGNKLPEIVALGVQEIMDEYPTFFVSKLDAEAAILYQFINDEP